MKPLPSKPRMTEIPYRKDSRDTIFVITEYEFDSWFDREIVPLFKDAVTVYGMQADDHQWQKWGFVNKQWTHKALLIDIQDIRPPPEPTADDLLRELVDYEEWQWQSGKPSLPELQEKARRYLESKK